MNRALAAVLTSALMLFSAVVSADDIKGQITAVTGRNVVIAGGFYTFPAAAGGAADLMAGLAVGQMVTLTFTIADGITVGNNKGSVRTVSNVKK